MSRCHRPDDEPWVAAERLTAAQATGAYTMTSACQAFAEARWGALEPGRAADMVLLADGPASTPARGIPGIEVITTFVQGRPVAGAEGD